jgi:hypothetical protein
MAHGRDVRPDIFQIDPLPVHGAAVAAVILHLPTVVPADLNRRPKATKGLWLPFGVVEQAVMARVQSARNREAGGDLYGDPVPELHLERHEVAPKRTFHFGAAGLENADAFCRPSHAPFEVMGIRYEVVTTLAVLLPEIEGRIGKDGINDRIANLGEHR